MPARAPSRATSSAAAHGAGRPQRGQRSPRRKRSWARHVQHRGWPAATVAPQSQHAGGASAEPRAASASRAARGASPEPTEASSWRAAVSTRRCWRPPRHASTARLRQSCAVAADASWTFDPGALALVGLAAVAYVPRWRRVRAQHGPRAAPVGRLLAFAAGLLALVAALISPIDRLGEQSFAMHMVQHILLLDIAPILLIVSLTKVILRPATRRLQRLERAAGPLAHPAARGRPLRRRHVGLAHPRALRRRAEPPARPRPRAHVLHDRRRPVLVAPHVADPLAARA